MSITPKENFLRLLRHDTPTWFGNPWDCFNLTPEGKPSVPDAVSLYVGRPAKGETGYTDRFGVVWDFPADQPGPTPSTDPARKVIRDIACWREYFDFPPLDGLPWDQALAMSGTLDRENKLVMCASPRGMFEFSHAMMGFEDALVNYIVEPESVAELLGAYADWKIAAAKEVIDVMRPDIILNHDDWGSKDKLFLPPAVWRVVVRPAYEKFYGYLKSRDVLIMHHCDCYAQDLATDMVELGIDIWQGPTPENDLRAVAEATRGRLFLLGGIDMSYIDFPDIPEDRVRDHIRRVIEQYAPLGCFLPCYTSIRPVHDRVMVIGNDEMARRGALYMGTHPGNHAGS
ncbi:MAG: uroporphyrinogen decarboxylase (URO-D) [Gracilibacteraceae bacterium]|jgi:hypothetical protein|nr:uroporphyrinogen decarboxylase (URO-D) [Gracilibacteraceae bacterium]